MNLKGKNVLITGGSIGIGLELAKMFLADEANVLVCARNLSALEKAKSENPKLKIAQCDVTIREQVENLLQRTKDLFGGIDILINNAAVFRRFNILEDYPLEKQLEEIDINLKGPVQVTNIFLKELLESKEPVIVNLTSGLAYVPMTDAQIYSATKAAINSWTQSLRYQLRKTKVRVVLLSPPAVDTRMNVNNPGVEGMKLISPKRFAELSLKGLKKNKNEILVSPINSLKLISRFAPRMAFRALNK
ncbi:MAG: SDR family NAD(P)-dependent oxidoreductase [Saprospiraceae bacterium]|nr:SDR family NAD(P)-dependent oxidoreductase [Saprospiraceae bacterium]